MTQDKINLLVVDDQKTILKAFSRLLKIREEKYLAEFHDKPEDALALIQDNPKRFHAILTDIRMPGMDGIEFIRRVKEISPDMPIVFMTAYFSPEVKEKALQFKRVAFLQKPFHLISILDQTIPDLIKAENRK